MGSAICIGFLANCLCCCSCCNLLCKEITYLIFSVLEIALYIWILIVVPWGDELIHSSGKAFFYVAFSISIVNFIILIILIYLTCAKKITTSKNCLAKVLSIILLVLTIILFILELFAFIIIENDLVDIHDRDAKWIRTDYGREQESVEKDFKAMFHLFAGLVILIFEFCQIIFSIYILILICKKTDLSLSAFKEKEKENQEIKGATTVVNVYNPTDGQIIMNNLQMTGYDVDGRPIFKEADLNNNVPKV
jgi:hypothetical protein